ncbi:hypothetical protein cyc_01275 [Cyclospora cayetanensis]|uniref:Uncharacterized protein n=1 Tax=Cyclospora cayetanensis TaxID=88456 RepID=A0A1D3CX20_9EIME|nr:hypothetical protein cyc_01275 [Cyclospora cayetanensis]
MVCGSVLRFSNAFPCRGQSFWEPSASYRCLLTPDYWIQAQIRELLFSVDRDASDPLWRREIAPMITLGMLFIYDCQGVLQEVCKQVNNSGIISIAKAFQPEVYGTKIGPTAPVGAWDGVKKWLSLSGRGVPQTTLTAPLLASSEGLGSNVKASRDLLKERCMRFYLL